MKCTIIPVITGGSGIVTKSLNGKCGSHIGKIFNRFAMKDSYTWNTTHNTENTAG
jgi:hypothetical protein